jgi:DNA-binding response OmpR family regulator
MGVAWFIIGHGVGGLPGCDPGRSLSGKVCDMQGKILIVDDNPVIVELLERKLGREGYEVMGCTESDKAMEMCLKDQPDLIILDILMPGKTGWDVMKELKAKSSTSSIPVIISSVKNRPEDMDKGKDLEATDYIAKPYVFGDLLEKVQKILGTEK